MLYGAVKLLKTVHMFLSLTQHCAKAGPLITHLTLGYRKEVD